MKKKAIGAVSTLFAVGIAFASEGANQNANKPTGIVQVFNKNGQVVQTFKTYKLGVTPSSPLPNAIRYNQKSLGKGYAQLNQAGVANVSLDAAGLSAQKTGETINFNFFGVKVPMTIEGNETHDNGDVSLIGRVGDTGRAIMTYGMDGSVFGQITTANGMAYTLEPAGDGNTALVNNTVAGRKTPSLEHDMTVPATATQNSPLATQIAEAKSALGLDNKTAIDLMVVYSATLQNAATRINYLVTSTNQAFRDSGLPELSVRMVNSYPVAYDDTVENGQTLDDLTNNALAFAGVNAAQTRNGADVVVFLRPLRAADQGSCGVAWVNGANGTPLQASNAYAVVADGNNGLYYCYPTTMAHELGHVMGSVHDLAHSGKTAGVFPYAHGYGINNLYGDIMSYYSPQIPKFSNPDAIAMKTSKATYYLGEDDVADVVKTFRQTAPVVAGFAPTVK